MYIFVYVVIYLLCELFWCVSGDERLGGEANSNGGGSNGDGKLCKLDSVPNDILKALPNNLHNMMYLFFLQCYHHKAIPGEWKHSITILLHRKDKPIALACIIYKLFMSTLTSILTTFGEQHTIFHYS